MKIFCLRRSNTVTTTCCHWSTLSSLSSIAVLSMSGPLLMIFLLTAALGTASCSRSNPVQGEEPQLTEQKQTEQKSTFPEAQWTFEGRSYRSLILPNQLKVVLVSDPKAQKSAAAMTVRVGSYEDPNNKEGLAHYLEHLLFLGTKKYPQVGEFRQFLSTHQGGSNANTWFDRTHYFMTVENESFQPALDRWSGFFSEPLFDEQFVEKEKSAVHSEYINRKDRFSIRTFRLWQIAHKQGHPGSKFLVGSKDTLANVSRQDVIDFYKKYYSANQMYLSLVGNHDLDAMESWVQEMFATVPNRNRPTLTYDPQPYDKTPSVYYFKPRGAEKVLSLSFAIPSQVHDHQSHTADFFSTLASARSKGSLYAELVKKEWATDVSVSTDNQSYSSYLIVDITLTEDGLKNWQSIPPMLFSYFQFLKKEGLKQFYFAENTEIAQKQFQHRDYVEPANLAREYSLLMHEYDPRKLEYQTAIPSQHNELSFQQLISNLTPENMKIFVIDPGATTTHVEPFYKFAYRQEKLSLEIIDAWAKSTDISPYAYPTHNLWLPGSLALISSNEQVGLIQTGPSTEAFYFSDTQFEQPRGFIRAQIYTPSVSSSAKTRALSELFFEAFKQSYKGWGYYPSLAGLVASVKIDLDGVIVNVSGFSDHLPAFVSMIGSQLNQIDITPGIFNAIKQELIRSFRQKRQQDPYVLAGEGLLSKSVQYWHSDLSVLREIENATYSDLRQFVSEELFKSVGVSTLAYGNLQPSEVKDLSKTILQQLNSSQPLAKSQWPQRQQFNVIRPGEELFFEDQSESGNNAYYSAILFGKRNSKSYQTQAALEVLGVLWGPSFFHDLRDEKQLGYLVHMDTAPGLTGAELRTRFVIQSNSHSADQLAEEINQWLVHSLESIKLLPDKVFTQIKQSIVANLNQPVTSMSEQLSLLREGTYQFDGDIHFKQSLIDAVKALTKEEFLAIIQEHLAPEAQKRVTGKISAGS